MSSRFSLQLYTFFSSDKPCHDQEYSHKVIEHDHSGHVFRRSPSIVSRKKKNEEKRESFDVSFKHLSTSPLFFARVVISSFSACVLIAVSMASSRTSCCQICQKAEVFFTCQNCGGDFCEDHINGHQEPASPQREDVLREHQEVQAMIDAYRMRTAQHHLLMEINRWERESIEKIQQTANEFFNSGGRESTDYEQLWSVRRPFNYERNRAMRTWHLFLNSV